MRWVGFLIRLESPFSILHRTVDTENDVDAIRLEINFLQAHFLLDIVKSDVRGSLFFLQSVLDPQNVFGEFGLADPRESYPKPSIIHRQNPAAPPQ